MNKTAIGMLTTIIGFGVGFIVATFSFDNSKDINALRSDLTNAQARADSLQSQ